MNFIIDSSFNCRDLWAIGWGLGGFRLKDALVFGFYLGSSSVEFWALDFISNSTCY